MVSVSGVLSLPKIKYVIQKYFVDNFEVVTSQRQEVQRIGQNLNPVDWEITRFVTHIVEICQ